jgi:hypothetical protein
MAAVHAAILDALKTVGIEDFDPPATSSRLWQAINQARSKERT